ncbi:MAG: DUF2256 domain-containing protein [Planctomycetota bacterium]|nr:DUF2256 domain-containing protein [Planctomycetota bacterium]
MRKSQKPEKVCATCGKPFTWRKKWSRCWNEVRFCSKRCKKNRRAGSDAAAISPLG